MKCYMLQNTWLCLLLFLCVGFLEAMSLNFDQVSRCNLAICFAPVYPVTSQKDIIDIEWHTSSKFLRITMDGAQQIYSLQSKAIGPVSPSLNQMFAPALPASILSPDGKFLALKKQKCVEILHFKRIVNESTALSDADFVTLALLQNKIFVENLKDAIQELPSYFRPQAMAEYVRLERIHNSWCVKLMKRLGF